MNKERVHSPELKCVVTAIPNLPLLYQGWVKLYSFHKEYELLQTIPESLRDSLMQHSTTHCREECEF